MPFPDEKLKKLLRRGLISFADPTSFNMPNPRATKRLWVHSQARCRRRQLFIYRVAIWRFNNNFVSKGVAIFGP